MNKLFTIAKNTFIETLRQPVYAIIIVAALLLFFLSPSLTMYTMSDDNKLLRELGLSTLFLTSLFIAIFSASGAVAEELENKTIMTVLTKPVRRPIFIVAKFCGVAGAVALAHFICTVALLMAIRHGVLESAADEHDWTVLASAGVVLGAVVLLSAFFNYAYDWKFSSTAIVLTGVFATLAIVFLAFIDRDWKFNPANNGINTVDIYGAILLLLGAMIVVALAVAISARFNIVVTLSACIGIFLLGLVNDHAFRRFKGYNVQNRQTGQYEFFKSEDLPRDGEKYHLEEKMPERYLWAKVGRCLVPNLQVFWISDAIYEENPVPAKYIAIVASYTLCYTAGILALAIALFQRRQVG
ncbi:MAG: ABC-2 transporter permease [Planctomycetes bacterium]|nr:ABC-2 transporter permease [Planctomycetota bacterium]MBL7154678.1 ABC-2 transporter permease [Phycisphaerae bacterium]